MTIANFYENITKPDHMPPEYIWPFDDEITKWFEAIRDEQDSGQSDMDDEYTPVALDNDYAERFK